MSDKAIKPSLECDDFEAELEAALKQAEHLSRALDKLLPRVGRTIHSSPFEPPEVVDEPYRDPDQEINE